MTEELWFLLIFWFVSIIIGLKWKQKYFIGLASIIGIFTGFLSIIDVYAWLGLIFIFASIYLLYYSLFSMTQRGTKG